MIKLLSLFSGIGAFEKALENIGINYELVNYCEIDKYASKSYSLIHNVDESKNLKDVTKVDTSKLPNDIDLVTYGFPCQDISIAGKQKGFKDDEGNTTRSGLFFEALRIIEDTKPKVAIAENVKALTSKKFKSEFKTVLDSLNAVGYNCYWKVLNAKDYGVPQNRERVFIVSIRKDIDNFEFRFPYHKELDLKLKDLLEKDVDEKYYLSEKMIKCMCVNNAYGRRRIFLNSVNKTTGIAGTLSTCEGSRPQSTFIKMINNEITDKTFLPISEATKKGYKEAYEGDYVNIQYPNSNTRRGRVGNGVANTLLTTKENGVVDDEPLRIRRLTEKECFRLMGFDDKDCDVLKENNISMTQLYKQAGNSIVVDVLEALFRSIYSVVDIEESEAA